MTDDPITLEDDPELEPLPTKTGVPSDADPAVLEPDEGDPAGTPAPEEEV